MKFRIAPGEALLCLVFAGVGAFWTVTALRMPLWEGFAPASGFLPLVYGFALIGLSIAALLLEGTASSEATEQPSIAKPLLVIAALGAGIAGIELIGFGASMFLTMLFLFCIPERLPPIRSTLVAALGSIALTLIFRAWLGVPLPTGPWGF